MGPSQYGGGAFAFAFALDGPLERRPEETSPREAPRPSAPTVPVIWCPRGRLCCRMVQPGGEGLLRLRCRFRILRRRQHP